MSTAIKVGITGLERMGCFYLEEIKKSGRWNIAYICDTNPQSREAARELSPESKVIDNDKEIFENASVQAIGLFTLADLRKEQIEKAVRYGKHIVSEKPIADTIRERRRTMKNGYELLHHN